MADFYESLKIKADSNLDKRRLFTPSQRREVLDRDGNICKHCGSTDNLEIDHIIEWNDYGRTEISNAQILCNKCNRKKATQAYWDRKNK